MPQRPLQVLLIDDEPDFLETLSFWLISKGYKATIATGGAEALECITQSCPDMVFLDIVMPRMDGLETLRWIRARYPTIPVVLLTTTEQPGAALSVFRALGIAGVFQKDGSLADVGRLLETALTLPQSSSSS